MLVMTWPSITKRVLYSVLGVLRNGEGQRTS